MTSTDALTLLRESIISEVMSEVEKRINQLEPPHKQEIKMYDPEQVAEMLSVDRSTVYRMCDEGQMQYIEVGSIRSVRKTRRIPHSEVERLVCESTKGGEVS